jgi:hypothetical protein
MRPLDTATPGHGGIKNVAANAVSWKDGTHKVDVASVDRIPARSRAVASKAVDAELLHDGRHLLARHVKVRTSTQFLTNFNTFRSPMEAPQMVPLLSTEMPSGKLAPPFGRGSGMKAVTTPSLTLPI